MKNLFNIKTLLYTIAGLSVTLCVSCNDYPDEYKVTDGVPQVDYIRLLSTDEEDDIHTPITEAGLGSTVCLVGNNLTSIKELFFNDQKAVLNTSLMTANSVIVSIPDEFPGVITDKIYMVNNAKDTVAYDFKVIVPDPVVRSMSCEFAKDGDVVSLYGDYLKVTENTDVSIKIGNVPVTEIIEGSTTEISFRVPEGAPTDYITLETSIGTCTTGFKFRDETGMLIDFDSRVTNGWKPGTITSSVVEPINGNYMVFQNTSSALDDNEWDDDHFCFTYWPSSTDPSTDLEQYFANLDWDNLQLKFEINVTSPWKGNALQMIFTGMDDVSLENQNNAYFNAAGYPRGLWRPWEQSGSYQTDGWQTVSFPLSDFKYDYNGQIVESLTSDRCSGITFFVSGGGVTGASSSPVICIDNVRVVPINK